MKILLISPSVKDILSYKIPHGISKVLSQNVGVYPPLGLATLGSILRTKGHKIVILHALAEGMSIDQIVLKIKNINPDIIGITCMSYTFLYSLILAKKIKQNYDIPIIIGGDHTTLYPKEVMAHKCFDYAVFGEGEVTFPELIDYLEKKKTKLEDINGILYRKKNKIMMNKPRKLIKNLDTLPFPARDFLKLDKYYTCNLPTPFTTMVTSRGCPYSCTFCSKTTFGNSYRYQSASRVVDEIEYCVKKLGIKGIDFFDDTFTLNIKRTYEIIELIKGKKLKFSFNFMTRVDKVEKKMLVELKKIGCKTIAYGVESGNEKILQSLNKGFNLTQAKNAIKLTNEAGIESMLLMMIGYPNETEKEIKDTIRFIREVKPGFVKVNILCPYPGSKLYKQFVENNIIEDFWRDVTLNGELKSSPPLIAQKISKKKLIKYRAQISRMNYFRKNSNIFKINKIYSWSDIKRVLALIFDGFFEKEI